MVGGSKLYYRRNGIIVPISNILDPNDINNYFQEVNTDQNYNCPYSS